MHKRVEVMTDAQRETLVTLMLEVPMEYWESLTDWGAGLMLAEDGTFYIDDSLHSPPSQTQIPGSNRHN